MHLLIDDERQGFEGIIARDADCARAILSAKLPLTAVSFDYQLDHRVGYVNGYDILKWALEESLLPDVIFLVSSSPDGRKRMGEALVKHGYRVHMDRDRCYVRNEGHKNIPHLPVGNPF